MRLSLGAPLCLRSHVLGSQSCCTRSYLLIRRAAACAAASPPLPREFALTPASAFTWWWGRSNRCFFRSTGRNELPSIRTEKSLSRLVMDGDSEQTRRLCFGMCQQYFGKAWKEAPFHDGQVRKVSGGLSNYLFVCSLPDDVAAQYPDEPRQVLVRFYGLASGDPVAVLQDSLVFALLSEKGLGPKFYGFFSGGRFEQYIPSRCLKTAELRVPELSRQIATKMADLHLLDMPLCKEPKMLRERMTRWLKAALASDGKFNDAHKDALWRRLTCSVDLESELRVLLRILDAADLPVTFCHNDLQEGNILIANDNPDLVLIDFEYAAYNYRGFDLANHFCEWCYDYTYDKPPYFKANLASYPTAEEQTYFLKHYYAALTAAKQQNGSDTSSNSGADAPTDHASLTAIDDEHLEQTVLSIIREADVCSLASHFHWLLWSLVSATTSQIEFGYLEYAQARLEGYYLFKERLLVKYPDLANKVRPSTEADKALYVRGRCASDEERQEG